MGAVGTVLVWIGFAILLGAAAGTVTSTATTASAPDRRPPRAAAGLAIAGAVLLVGALALPWLRGTATDGSPLTLTGWSGLDPLSVGALLVGSGVAVVVAVGLVRRPAAALLTATAVGLLALVGGNLLVQADQPDGSRVAAAGFSVALVAIAVVGAAALVTRIGGSSSGSPSGSTG